MADAVAKIADASGYIRDIETISRTTEILALNAAVEAARAGQSGKGFAIVASEMKGLSVRTKELADGVSALLEQIGAAVKGMAVMNDSEA